MLVFRMGIIVFRRGNLFLTARTILGELYNMPVCRSKLASVQANLDSHT